MEYENIPLLEAVISANTGGDAIKRAPIVDYVTNYRCLRIGDISNNRSFEKWGYTNADESVREKFLLKKNDILIARTGNTIGVSKVIEKDLKAVFNNGLIRIRIKNSYDPYYIYSLVSSNLFKNFMYQISGGTSTQPNVKIKHLLSFPIPKIAFEKQKKIGSFLKTIDEKIEINTKVIQNLEELAQTLFKRWFIDFEFLNEDGEPYKSSGGEMVKSSLGNIPSEWNIKNLTDIASYHNGLAMQKYRPENNENSLPVLKIRELNQGFIEKNAERCKADIKESAKVYNGDVIFSWSGTLLVKLWVGGNAGLNQHLFKVTSESYPKWFYYYWTKHHLNQFIAIAADKATTMGHIKRSHLSESKVVIPTPKELEKFTNIINPIVDEIIEKGIENKRLQDLRDTLLPKLLSGEIKLPDETEVTEHVPIS